MQDALLSLEDPIGSAASFTTLETDDPGRVVETSYLARDGADLPALE